jgi:hypothetical protein
MIVAQQAAHVADAAEGMCSRCLRPSPSGRVRQNHVGTLLANHHTGDASVS